MNKKYKKKDVGNPSFVIHHTKQKRIKGRRKERRNLGRTKKNDVLFSTCNFQNA